MVAAVWCGVSMRQVAKQFRQVCRHQHRAGQLAKELGDDMPPRLLPQVEAHYRLAPGESKPRRLASRMALNGKIRNF